MARYTGPKSKISRKYGEPIFGDTKALERKPHPPGQHGRGRRRKKSEYAMISNFFRNVLNPIVVFYIAKYISASFNTFFWIWVVINLFFSMLYLMIVLYYLKSRLEKSSAVVHP